MGDCPAPLVKPFATTGRIVVAQKGEIDFALAGGACTDEEGGQGVRNEPQHLTITGGTGIYQGASGEGGAARTLDEVGTEWWTGTLTVPGLEFDVTPPKIAGAVRKTVHASARAKRVRVAYRVTARDAVDGVVPVRCVPRSRSWFKRGRTAVRCRASDKSANTASARFVVTVHEPESPLDSSVREVLVISGPSGAGDGRCCSGRRRTDQSTTGGRP